jgi:hypothetical protein
MAEVSMDERCIRAAENNAQWCDSVCCAHRVPGEFRKYLWLNRSIVPRFYPNVITLGGSNSAQLQAIDELIADHQMPAEWALKDSFAAYDLISREFGLLFEAEWIYLSDARPLVDAPRTHKWTTIRDRDALAEWERVWALSQDAQPSARIFPASLLENPAIVFVAGYREEQIVTGAIGNNQARVVGWSNFFAASGEDGPDCARSSLGAIAQEFSGLPIVGYEGGESLSAAKSLGFESIGPLRVWWYRTSK